MILFCHVFIIVKYFNFKLQIILVFDCINNDANYHLTKVIFIRFIIKRKVKCEKNNVVNVFKTRLQLAKPIMSIIILLLYNYIIYNKINYLLLLLV